MKQRELLLFFVIFIGLCGLAAALYLFAKPVEGATALAPSLAEGVFAEMRGPNRITSTHNGRLAWTVEDQGLVYYRGRGQVDVYGPHALIPLTDGGTVEVNGLLGFYEQDSQDISLHGGVGVVMSKAGRTEWKLAAENAYYRKAAEAFELDGMTGKLTPAGGDTVAIAGGLGRYDIKHKTMTLDQDVRCRFQGGITLTTSHINYDVGADTADTDAAVAIEGKGFTLQSAGLLANLKTKQVVAPANVRLKLDPKKAKPAQSGGSHAR